MPLEHLQHFLIQTADVDRTRDWYVDVLGLETGYTPDFKFKVCWLYLGDRDVLHITEGGRNVTENRKTYLGQQSEATEGTGVIDHVAFHATGLQDMIAHFERTGVAFTERQVNAQGLYQLFLFDPNGVKVELNFPNEEAQGRTPPVTAADLKPQ